MFRRGRGRVEDADPSGRRHTDHHPARLAGRGHGGNRRRPGGDPPVGDRQPVVAGCRRVELNDVLAAAAPDEGEQVPPGHDRGTRSGRDGAGERGEAAGGDRCRRRRLDRPGLLGAHGGLHGVGADQRHRAAGGEADDVGRRSVGVAGGPRARGERPEADATIRALHREVVLAQDVEAASAHVEQQGPCVEGDGFNIGIGRGVDLGEDIAEPDGDVAGSQVQRHERTVVVEHDRPPEDPRMDRRGG